MATVFLNWGDTNKQQLTLTGTSVSVNHIYADTSGYIIDLSGRTSQISGMTLSGVSITNISGFSDTRMTISSLNLNNNKFITIPLINDKLKYLYLNDSISGATSTVPNYSGSTLETLHINRNNLTGYTVSSLPTTMHVFLADDNNLNTTGVTNIVNEMHDNISSKSGMTISLINNGTLLDTTKKYDMIDFSGSTVKTMGRFSVEVIRSDGRESGHTFTIMITKPVTSKDTKCHIDYGDTTYSDIIMSGSTYYSNYSIIGRLYTSGVSSTTYYPSIDGYLDDITDLTINNTHSNTGTLNIKEFTNLKSLTLPYYSNDYYYGYQQGYYTGQFTGFLDMSRNSKMETLNFPYMNFTSLAWPRDPSKLVDIRISGNYNCVTPSPRIDLMPDLLHLEASQLQCTGVLYPPHINKKLNYYDMGWNWTLTPATIPDFTDCTGITYLNLGGTGVNSNGLTDWSTLTKLDELNLSNNMGLTGSTPDFTGVLKMRYLNLGYTGYNNFGVHSNWDTMTGLTQVYLTGNQYLVDSMVNLTGSTELTSLQLYGNKLTGQFDVLSYLPKLQSIQAQNNILSKEFPIFTGNTMLNDINFGSNKYNDFGQSYGLSEIKVLGDGTILVCGQFSSYSGQTTNKIMKLNSNGTINNPFDEWDRFTEYNWTNEQVKVIAVQPDGKILIGGDFTSYSGVTYGRLIRLNSGGTVDSTFNTGIGFGSGDYVNAIVVQPDGKILVGGYLQSYKGSSTYKHLIRLDSGGTVDNEWNPSGGLANGSYGYVNTIKLQPDGKILVGGYFTQYDYNNAAYLVRVNTGGTFDSTFDYTNVFNTSVNTIEIQTDGKILVGGAFTSCGSYNTRYIARLQSGGTFDTTFNYTDGFDYTVNIIKQQTDGKILVGGQFATYSGQTARNLIRLNSGGTIDNTFDISNGFENAKYSWYTEVKTLAVQTDGKIMVGGKFYSYSGTTANKIIRLNSGGTIDNTFVIGSNRSMPDLSYNTHLSQVDFSTCGLNTWFDDFTGLTNLSNLNLRSNNFVRFPDFSNLTNLYQLYLDYNSVIDDLSVTCSLSNTRIAYLELAGNRIKGSIPLCWSGLSYLYELNLSSNMVSGSIPEFFNDMPTLVSINLASNDLTSGLTYLSGKTNMRYLDLGGNNFSGTTMFDMTNFNNLSYISVTSCGLVGNIFTNPNINNIQYYYLGNNNFVGNMPPINSNYTGSQYIYDTSSNFFTGYTSMVGSQCWLDYGYFSYNYLSTTELNKLVIDASKSQKNYGALYINGPNMGTVTGQALLDLENLYAKNWQITYNLPECNQIGYIKVITKQTDGKLLLGGDFTSYSGTTAGRIIRLNTNFTIDNTFDSAYGFDDVVNDIKVQTDGKIVVGGKFTTYSGQTCNRIIRLNSGGTIDNTFSIGYGFNNHVETIAIQGDGKILVGGWFTVYSGTTQQYITRLNSGGTIDSTFIIGIGFNATVENIIVQSGGTIVVGGSFTYYNGNWKNYIARLSSGGTFDTGFGGGSAFNSNVYVMKEQPDGKILVGGSFNQYNSYNHQYLVRLDYDGFRDVTFDTSTGFNQYVYAISLQSDGKVMVGGNFTSYSGHTANRIVRLDTGATYDNTFDTSVGFDNNTYGTVDMLYSQGDDKTLVSGKFSNYSGITTYYLTRINTGATIDTSFYYGTVFDNGKSVVVDSVANMLNFRYTGDYDTIGLVTVSGLTYFVATSGGSLVWDFGGSGEYTFVTYSYTTITRMINGTNFTINYYQGWYTNYYIKIKKV